MDVTLLEVHLDDASFTANAPFSDDSSTKELESMETESPADEEQTGLPALLPFILGLGALAGIAYLVRRLRGGEETGTDIEAEIGEPEAPTP